MARHALIFGACFALGALITLVIRVSRHQPFQQSEQQSEQQAEQMPAPAMSH